KRFPHWSDRLRRLFEVDALLQSDDPQSAAHVDTRVDESAPCRQETRRVGPYVLLDKIGGGGMGVVYRAHQDRPDRLVALKLLKAGAEAGAVELVRFKRETEAAARLQHSNIVTVFAVGDHEGQPYMAMELVEGGDLRGRLAAGPLPVPQAAELGAVLAR